MEDTGKKGLGQKLKEKLHLGHSSKSSNASDDSGFASQGQASVVLRYLLYMIGFQQCGASTSVLLCTSAVDES